MPDPHHARWRICLRIGRSLKGVFSRASGTKRGMLCGASRYRPAGACGEDADDGIAAPACVLWGAHDPIQNRIYVVSELYRAGMLPQEMARRVLERDRTLLIAEPSGQTREHGASLSGLIDAASFADPGNGRTEPWQAHEYSWAVDGDR